MGETTDLALFHPFSSLTSVFVFTILIIGMSKFLSKLRNLDKITFFAVSSFLVLLTLVIYSTTQVRALQVPPLPEGNLLLNPWFRSSAKPNASGLDHWIDASPSGLLWSTSQKDSNPTADVIVSGKCGGSFEQYCGTSARFANGRGQGGGGAGQSGVDAYLYQVVPADPSLTNLKFMTHWVTGEIVYAEAKIYGGDTIDGPWTLVWVPFSVNEATGSQYDWTKTDLLETTIPSGWNYYKVQLSGKYPSGTSQGVKYTGVYFAVADGNGVPVTPTLTLTPTPTAGVTATPTPTSVPSITVTPTVTNVPSPTPTQTPVPSPNPNNSAPVIRTTFLSNGSVGSSYSYTLTGYDANGTDTLSMTAQNTPPGLSLGTCTSTKSGSQVRLYCPLSGVPTQSGSYQVTVTISDQLGASDSKTFGIVIN